MRIIIILATILGVVNAHWGGGSFKDRVALDNYHVIRKSLSEAERLQLAATLTSNRDKSKAEVKTALAQFVGTLPAGAELQALVAAQKAQTDAIRAVDGKKIETMSAAAKTLYASLNTIFDNDSITYNEEIKRVQTILRSVSDETRLEFSRNGVRLLFIIGDGEPHRLSRGRGRW